MEKRLPAVKPQLFEVVGEQRSARALQGAFESGVGWRLFGSSREVDPTRPRLGHEFEQRGPLLTRDAEQGQVAQCQLRARLAVNAALEL